MTSSVPGWTTIAENPLVLVREYSFGPGYANALAIGLPNGKLLIASPPTGVPEADLKALGACGGVGALVAINGTHHLGLGPLRSAFPEAVTYAATKAAERIRKKGKGVGPIEPLEQLRPLLGDKIDVVEIDACKMGDVLLRVRTEKGAVLYASDFIANIQRLPNNLLFKLVFKLTDSGPGLKVFNLFFKFYVTDKKRARDALIREIEVQPLAILVPAHGDVVTRSDLGPTLVSMLRAAL